MNTEKVIANIRADVIGIQDEVETVTDSITRLELLRKLSIMKMSLIEADFDLKLEAVNLRLKVVEDAIAGTAAKS